jgi:hypothetical protein
MSGKKQKLLRKYLKKRNAEKKIYLIKSGDKINRHSISKEIRLAYTTANSLDKRVLTKFFQEVIG